MLWKIVAKKRPGLHIEMLSTPQITRTMTLVRLESSQTPHQMVWPWKLQSSHLDSSSIFQKVLSHSPVSSFFSLIQSATCIIRRGMSQSLQRDSTVSSSSRGREVLLNNGPHASLSLQTSSICSNEYSGFHSCPFCRISPMVVSAVTGTANMPKVVKTFTSGT